MWLPWQDAAVLAVAIGAFGVAFRSNPARWLVITSAVAREAALILVLYSVWQLAGSLSLLDVNRAFDHARTLIHVERVLHINNEAWMQHRVLPYPWLVQFANVYYAVVHVPALIAFLVWLFFRHRRQYPPVRNTIALLTGACLLVQLLPVAPPRMFPQLGFVDTGKLYSQSVYGAVGTGVAAQLSALPSVHVAWSVVIGVTVVLVSTSKWRWLVLAHPVLTMLVVVVTANHWWLDGIVAVLFLGAAMLVTARRNAEGRLVWPPPRPVPELVTPAPAQPELPGEPEGVSAHS
jgi:hypothetical protein